LLNLRRPFMNHNGVNSLKFSPETKKLILTTGDGGSGYDPFNLSQDIMEVAGKVIEIDVAMSTFMDIPEVTRFDELPESIYRALSVIAKGVRNIPGISFQRYYNQYIKYVGNVGQDLVESIFSFVYYTPIPVTEIIQASSQNRELNQEALINLGWRGWEGDLPTPVIRGCSSNPSLTQETIAYLNEAISTSTGRIHPLTCYYHIDSRPEKFSGSALTGVQPYMGSEIPDLTGCVIFTDFVLRDSQPPSRGVLAYTKVRPDCKENDYGIIEPDYNFYNQSSYYVSLGTNLNQSRLYLGVYGSSNVTDYNKGTIFEIVE